MNLKTKLFLFSTAGTAPNYTASAPEGLRVRPNRYECNIKPPENLRTSAETHGPKNSEKLLSAFTSPPSGPYVTRQRVTSPRQRRLVVDTPRKTPRTPHHEVFPDFHISMEFLYGT